MTTRTETPFTVTPANRDDPKDELARELAMVLVDHALVKWNDREDCRCMLRLALLGKRVENLPISEDRDLEELRQINRGT